MYMMQNPFTHVLTPQIAPPETSGLTVVHKVRHLHKCLLTWVSDSNYTLCQEKKKAAEVSSQNRVTCKWTLHTSSPRVSNWWAKLWNYLQKPLEVPIGISPSKYLSQQTAFSLGSDFLDFFFYATGVPTTHVLDEHDWCYVSKPGLLLHPLFRKCLV